MIPVLTLDTDAITKNWKGDQESIDWVKKYCNAVYAENSTIPLYQCDENYVDMEVFKEFKKICTMRDFHDYGYCDNEESLVKYLQKYVDDKDNNYFVHFGFMSMDYEKYYKNGTYINKDGIDTDQDYYLYIDQHPEMKIDQEFENKWITYTVRKLK